MGMALLPLLFFLNELSKAKYEFELGYVNCKIVERKGDDRVVAGSLGSHMDPIKEDRMESPLSCTQKISN